MNKGMIKGMSDKEYHAQLSPEEHSNSSSQLKTILDSPEKYYEEYLSEVKKPTKENPAFTIGTCFHSRILEPDTFSEECAIFDGAKRGPLWKAFEEEHKGKTILSGNMNVVKYNNLVESTLKNDEIMKMHEGGDAEVSFFTEIDGLRIKVRADYLNLKEGYIVDLKSSTGALGVEDIQDKTEAYSYDLSAALYIDAVNKVMGEGTIKHFYWAYASKDITVSKLYLASPESIEVGRAKYKKAIALIHKWNKKKWTFDNKVCLVTPKQYILDKWLPNNTNPWE